MQDAIVPNRAVGYTRESEDGKPQPGPQRANVYTLPARSSSAGGGYSTAPDLLAFDAAMRADKLLSAGVDGLVLLRQVEGPGRGRRAAQALRRLRLRGRLTAGVNARASRRDLDTGYTIVVLSNDDPPSAETVAKKIRQWLGLTSSRRRSLGARDVPRPPEADASPSEYRHRSLPRSGAQAAAPTASKTAESVTPAASGASASRGTRRTRASPNAIAPISAGPSAVSEKVRIAPPIDCTRDGVSPRRPRGR